MRHLPQVVLLLRLARDNYVYPKDLAQTSDTPESSHLSYSIPYL